MIRLRRHLPPDVLLDLVVESEFQLRVLAELPERLRHRPLRIEDGEDVADARLAVPGEFFDAADRDPEGRYPVHAPHSAPSHAAPALACASYGRRPGGPLLTCG